MKNLKLKPTEILVLRTCKDDGTSRNGFRWPKEGRVECPDWDPEPVCGYGLHGLPWGVGEPNYLHWNEKCNNGWVVKVNTSKDYVHGEGEFYDKCKFKSATVVLSNASRKDCIDLISKYAPKDSKINWANQLSHNNSTQIAGDSSTQTAESYSVQNAGKYSTQTVGFESIQNAGSCSIQIAGYHSTQTSENNATQTAGYGSTQIAGNAATQTAGDNSTQTAGYLSTQTAGDMSIQSAGEFSIQTCGNKCYQKSGYGTSQTYRWFNNIVKRFESVVRIIDVTSAYKWFYVENGVWRLATKTEIKKNKLN